MQSDQALRQLVGRCGCADTPIVDGRTRARGTESSLDERFRSPAECICIAACRRRGTCCTATGLRDASVIFTADGHELANIEHRKRERLVRVEVAVRGS